MRLKKIKNTIEKYCQILGVPLSERPSFDILDLEDKRVEIDIIDGEYWYIINDKVNRFNNSSTRDPIELIYWIFSEITFDMAQKYCKELNFENQDDYNEMLEKKQIELISKLDNKMLKRLEEHKKRLADILET